MTAPSPRSLNVFEFKRVSTDRQDTERQEFDLSDNRARFAVQVVRSIAVKVSGTKVMSNEDVQQMMAELPKVDGVSVSSIDRLFRPDDFSFLLLQEFHQHRKVIISTKEGFVEPWTPEGWATCMRAAMQAGSELFEIKRRTSGGRRTAHAHNTPMNTATPYGILYLDKYHRDARGKSQYFIEDMEPASNGQSKREVVVMIFQWRYAGMKTYQIVRKLNDMGILSAGGRILKNGKRQFEPGLWSRATVIQLLKNKHYIGEHWEGGKLIKVVCPQFITREVFEAVQESLVPKKEGRPSKLRILSHLLYCARCGGKHRMYTSLRRSVWAYRCTHFDYRRLKRACDLKQVTAEVIERVVFAAVWKHITDPALLLRNARAYYDSLPTRSATAKLEKERESLKVQIARNQRMVEKGTKDEDEGNARILELMAQVRAIEADLRTSNSIISLPTIKQAEAGCRKIAEGRMPSTFAGQRPILDTLVDFTVHFDGEYAVISGKVPVAETGQKCNRGISSGITSALYIPFRIKERVA